MTASALRVAVLFPELLGTYGDGGNVSVLRQRLRWRGLTGEFILIGLSDPVPAQCDLYVLGGGEDNAQAQALSALLRSPGLRQAAQRGAPVLAVCAGMQLLGSSVTNRAGTTSAGLGLLDAATHPRSRRAVGEVVAQPAAEVGLPLLLGFENHAGGTELGPDARPLATVLRGVGNGAPDQLGRAPQAEGALQGSVIATYLHGPVLAHNPALADLLLSRAIGQDLPALSRPHHDLARQERLAGPSRQGRRQRWTARRGRATPTT